MNLSIIISTYNNPEWLYLVLVGYSNQTMNEFELVIADDGSSSETKEVIENVRNKFQLAIKHVWHSDKGFRKTEILNKAVVQTGGDYVIFSDGDCIPRKDFVATHHHNAQNGYYLSGGAFRLPMNVSKAITEDDILSENAFKYKWLKSKGLKSSIKILKLTHSPLLARILNMITPAKATWNGNNASTHRSNIITTNGFNEKMKYGAEDREFGSRLDNLKMKTKQLRYSAVCLHLDHARGYVNEEDWKRNREIWEETRRKKSTFTQLGLNQYSNKKESSHKELISEPL